MAAVTNFDWPWQYSFPPFFTIQLNLATRNKQLEAWCNLVLSYYKSLNEHRLDVTEAQSCPLFYNRTINMSLDSMYVILEELCLKGNVEWLDKQKQQCYVYWRTPEEWGKLIYDWASSHGMTNSVCTLFELTNGEDTTDEPFRNLDLEVLKKSLHSLERQGKAELLSFDDSDGVKFF